MCLYIVYLNACQYVNRQSVVSEGAVGGPDRACYVALRGWHMGLFGFCVYLDMPLVTSQKWRVINVSYTVYPFARKAVLSPHKNPRLVPDFFFCPVTLVLHFGT